MQSEVQLIGVELAYRDMTNRETELDMFSCKHTMPREPAYGQGQVRLTIHTSDGDITILKNSGLRTGTFYTN